jgi:uncharacterized membrane protein
MGEAVLGHVLTGLLAAAVFAVAGRAAWRVGGCAGVPLALLAWACAGAVLVLLAGDLGRAVRPGLG